MNEAAKGNEIRNNVTRQSHTKKELTSVPYSAENIKLEGGRDRKIDVIAIVKARAWGAEARGRVLREESLSDFN